MKIPFSIETINKNFKNKDLILTILIIVSLIFTKSSINSKKKLIFLLMATLICIYDLKYLFPFIITFLILTLHHSKILRKDYKEKNNQNTKTNIETFVNKDKKALIPFNNNNLDNGTLNSLTPKKILEELKLESTTEDIPLKLLGNLSPDIKTKIKLILGILFTQSSRRDYNNFTLRIAEELGLSGILNNSVKITDIDDPDFQNLKKSLQEMIIQIFIDNYVNKKGAIKDINDFKKEVVNFDYDINENQNYNDNLFNFEFSLEDYLTQLSSQNNLLDRATDFQEKLNKYLLKININPINDSFKNVNDLRKEIDNVTKKIGLFSAILRKTPENERRKKYLYLNFNVYTIILKGIIDKEKLNKIITDEDKSKQKENLVTKNEREDKFSGIPDSLNLVNIFHNAIFLTIEGDFFVPNLFTELEYVEEPSPSGIEDTTNKEKPRWYEDNELKSFYDVTENDLLSERELDKYYKAMNFKTENLKEINKQAEKYNEMLKIKDVSFNNKIDEISSSVFEIIDELRDLFNRYFSLEAKEETETKLGNIDFYITLVTEISNIITKENRILASGTIFILLSLFLYFIDNSSQPVSREKNLYELLNDIRI